MVAFLLSINLCNEFEKHFEHPNNPSGSQYTFIYSRTYLIILNYILESIATACRNGRIKLSETDDRSLQA